MRFRELSGIAVLICVSVCMAAAQAQTANGGLHGQVTDPSGAVVTKATVNAIGANGQTATTLTNAKGAYEIKGLAPGKYTVLVTATGFAPETQEATVTAGAAQALDIALNIAVEQQNVTVEDQSTTVSTDAASNANAIVIKGKDLEALSDDPDELAQDLQALAGPSAGPNGGQIYVDGFSNGVLPPKASIREIRVNQNPFSAQFDRPGFGRVEVLTKPGIGTFHGQFQINGNDSVFNTLTPILVPGTSDLGSHVLMYSGNLSGPLNKNSSFFMNFERRQNSGLSVINAKLPCDPASSPACITDPGDPTNPYAKYTQLWPNPRVGTEIGPRLDYQLSKNNTLTVRYQYEGGSSKNNGMSDSVVPASISPNGLTPSSNSSDYNHELRIMDTQVINTSTINETRLQIERSHSETSPLTPGFSRSIQDMFTFGGNTSLPSHGNRRNIELQNYTSKTHKNHFFRFGGRLRTVKDAQFSTGNYYGSYSYLSLDNYNQGIWYKFSQTTGNPWASISQADAGLYAEDDWRLRSNLTLSYGLRFETQDNIPSSHANFAPRVGVAWGLNQKTVLRAGFGTFYDRLGENTVLQVRRSGANGLQSYSIMYSPNIPMTAAGTPQLSPQVMRTPAAYAIDSNYQAPYMGQLALTLERQATKTTKVTVNYIVSRGLHQLVTENRGVTTSINPSTGLYPADYVYQTAGTFKQQQLMVGSTVNANKYLSLNAWYVYSDANSNTSGPSSPLATDPLHLSADWGRASFNRTHRGMIFGNINLPKGLRLNPMIMVSSGASYNLTTGIDSNLDGRANERPYFYPGGCANVQPGAPSNGVYNTAFGCFSVNNIPGQNLVRVPINYLNSPGMFNANLRVSKTFGFGKKAERARGGGDGGGRPGGDGGGHGGREGMGGVMMAGGSHMRGGASSGQKYSLTVAAMARNLFDNVNYVSYSGNIASKNLGQPGSIMTFGPGGSAANRLISFSMSFAF